MGSTSPFVSEKFRKVMSLVLGRHVEFLPLTQLRGLDYYVLNVTTVVDCLDLSKSDILNDTDEPGKILHIDKFVFDPQRLIPAPVFKVPQDVGNIFVAQPFIDAARSGGLSGIGFDDPEDIRLVKGRSPVEGFPT
jgi:hypothetical protein